jgi:hypothetical protein
MKEQRVDYSNAHLHQQGFFGEDIYVRQMSLPAGGVHDGHQHTVDHVSNILSAPLRIHWRKPNGETGVAHIEMPCKLLIKADTWHRFEALENEVRWECWFFRLDDIAGNFYV